MEISKQHGVRTDDSPSQVRILTFMTAEPHADHKSRFMRFIPFWPVFVGYVNDCEKRLSPNTR